MELKYELNTPNTAAELLEGEVMAIDFEAGLYYSLRNSAATIWELLVNHYNIWEIVQELEPHLEQAATLVPAFVQDLKQHKLIRPSTEPAKRISFEHSSVALTPPELEKFDDMQALLLLDPIHEVEPSVGWPFKVKN